MMIQIHQGTIYTTPKKKTNITMEKQAFEDVSPVKNGDFPLSF